jgi:DNA-binding GntR family transcriptional regulator
LSSKFEKLEPVSKKQRVVETLKAAVLSGALKSGEPIVEGKIAQQFGVGQGLIREALIDLEHMGFVQRTPFSGTQVVNMGPNAAQQIFEIRIALEPLAVLLAGAALTSHGIDELHRLAGRVKRAAEKQDLTSFFESHLAFRRQIWKLSGNKYLERELERTVIPLYALYLIRTSTRREDILRTVTDCVEHQENIIAAYRASDFAEAQRIAREFLERMKEYLKVTLPPTTESL